MSRRHRSGNSVSLFPFLAVLVCAMGALIFLLIVTTSRIRTQAVARAEQAAERLAPQPPLPETAIEPEPAPVAAAELQRLDPDAELRAKISRLSERLGIHRAEIERQVALTSAARARADEIAAALRAAEAELQTNRQEQQLHAESMTALQRDADELPQQYEATVRQLRKLQQQRQDVASKYAVVAYDGMSGTTRRPLLIECTDKGLRFLPEDILITPEDVDGFTEGFNPVLAGASTLVKYWHTKNRLAPAEQREPEPYVLLLVRPSGTMTYYLARKLLSTMKQPYGYELLLEDQALAIPEVDPQAKALCAAAVQEVMAERERVRSTVAAVQGPGGREIRFRRGGGFEVIEAEEDGFGGRFAGIRRGAADHGERGSGFGERGSRRTPEGAGSSSRLTAASGNGSTSDGRIGEGRSGDERLPGNGTSKEPGLGGEAEAPRDSLAGGGLDDGALGQPGMANGAVAGEAGPAGADRAKGDAVGGAAIGGIPSEEMTNGDLAASGFASAGSAGTPFGRDDATGVTDGRSSGDLSEVMTETKSSTSAGDGTGSGAGSAFSAAGAGSTVAGGRAGGAGPRPADASQEVFPAFGQPASTGRSPRRMDRVLRRRWGESSLHAGIGFERELTVRVDANRVTVGNQPAIAAGQGELPEELAERVAAAIDDEAQAWGRPPENFYWVPTLRFVVTPGGNRHSERLRGRLNLYGLDSTVDYRLDTAEPSVLPPLQTRTATAGEGGP